MKFQVYKGMTTIQILTVLDCLSFNVANAAHQIKLMSNWGLNIKYDLYATHANITILKLSVEMFGKIDAIRIKESDVFIEKSDPSIGIFQNTLWLDRMSILKNNVWEDVDIDDCSAQNSRAGCLAKQVQWLYENNHKEYNKLTDKEIELGPLLSNTVLPFI